MVAADQRLTPFTVAGLRPTPSTSPSTTESLLISFRNEFFEISPEGRLRPVPEAGVCLAYTRDRPALHRLNATAWLLVSLCDGRSEREIIAEHRATTMDAAQPARVLREILGDLVGLGIIRQFSNESLLGDGQ